MDLTSELFALLAPTQLGEQLADLELVDVSAELGLRVTVAVQGREIVVELDPVEEGRRFAARTKHFTLGYRVGDRKAPLAADVGRAVCEVVARRVAENEDTVVARLRENQGHVVDSTRIRETRGDRLLQRAGDLAQRYWTLSPYVGCLIGCQFCYAPSRLDPLRRLGGLSDVKWGSWVDVRVDAPEVLARELVTLPAWPIKLCPIVSDPYHSIERKYRVTRRCLEVLAAAPPRDVLVLTRSASIVDDAALLATMPGARAGLSLPTIDDEVRRHFEPRGATIADRLAALDTLRAAGVRTFVIIQPMFPGSVDALADALAARVESVRIDVLYGTYGAGREFADPAYAHVADDAWQRQRAEELALALTRRGVAIWPGELPG
jgi:DNA repair photolyase